MQFHTHSDPNGKLLRYGLSDGTMKGGQIKSKPSVTLHHFGDGRQRQLFTHHGTQIPQTGHHRVEVNRKPSVRETPLYVAAAPVPMALISGHNSQTLQCGQSQPRAVMQNQQALFINNFQVPVSLTLLANETLPTTLAILEPLSSMAKLNNDNSLSCSKPIPNQISGSISVNPNLQSNFPGVGTLLIKQSDLNNAVHPGHIPNGQRTVVSCGDNHSLLCAQEKAVNGGKMVQSSSSPYNEQSASSVLVLNDSRFQNLRGNGVTLVNSSNVVAPHPDCTIGLTKPTCFSSVNSVLPLPITISQSPKAVSFQCLNNSFCGNSAALHSHGSPSNNISPNSSQSLGNVIHTQVQTFREQSKMPTQRAVAVVPPISQQCPDDSGVRKKQNPVKIQHVLSESAEKTKENLFESGCNPSVTDSDSFSTKSSSDHNRVEHQSSHQTVGPVRQCVSNLSQSIEQTPIVTEHPEVHSSGTDTLKPETEGTTIEPNQRTLTSSPSDKSYSPLDGISDYANVLSRTPIVKYSLGMLKELVVDQEAEYLKQNRKSDDGPDLVHTLLDLYWGGSSYNYMTAKAGAIQNALQEACEFEVADESMIFDGIKMEDLCQLKDRFHILHEDYDVSSLLKYSSSTGIKEKVAKPDKEPAENSFISETCRLLSPEQEKNVKDDLCSDTETIVSPMNGAQLEVPHCSPSAETFDKTDVESTVTKPADNDQKSGTDLSNLCVNVNAINDSYSSKVQSIPVSEKQDHCDIQVPENNPPVEMTMLSSDMIKFLECEENDKVLCNEPPSPSPSTGEGSIEEFSKIKIQVLSPDEVMALSNLFHEDGKDGSSTSSQDTPHSHADDEKELDVVPMQNVNVNQEQSQIETVDDDGTLDLSRGAGDPSVFTSNKSDKTVHNHPQSNKKVIKNKLQHGSQEKSLIAKDVVEPRHVPHKTRDAQALNGQAQFSKLCDDQRTSLKAKKGFLSPAKHVHGANDTLHQYHHTKSIATPSGKDFVRSSKRKGVEHHGEDEVAHKLKKSHELEKLSSLLHNTQARDRLAVTARPGGLVKEQEEKQSDCSPKISSAKLSIGSPSVERSAKEKVLRNWVSTYVPTDVKTRRPSDPIEKGQRGSPFICQSLKQVSKSRLQKIKNDARYWTINR